MDPELRSVIEELRNESCPENVHHSVRMEIHRRAGLKAQLTQTVLLPLGLAAAIFFSVFFIIGKREPIPAEPIVVLTEPSEEQQLEQATQAAILSLAYVGSLLAESTQPIGKEVIRPKDDPLRERYERMKIFFNKLQ